MVKPVWEDLGKVSDLAGELRKRLANEITVEYPGCIAVKVHARGNWFSLWFGNANPVIEADVNIVSDDRLEPTTENGGFITTYVESICPDIDTLACGITNAVLRFVKNKSGELRFVKKESGERFVITEDWAIVCDCCGKRADELTQKVDWPSVQKDGINCAPMVCDTCLKGGR